MTATAFDTLATARRLKEAGLPEEQAVAVTDAIRVAHEANVSNLATKADLRETEFRLRAEMSDMKAELIKWFVGIAFAQSALVVTLLKLFPGR